MTSKTNLDLLSNDEAKPRAHAPRICVIGVRRRHPMQTAACMTCLSLSLCIVAKGLRLRDAVTRTTTQHINGYKYGLTPLHMHCVKVRHSYVCCMRYCMLVKATSPHRFAIKLPNLERDNALKVLSQFASPFGAEQEGVHPKVERLALR